ncbi:MAG: hypothetical protein KatS3mg089_0512 [Patescibacteria group bacterium]|nr:MAG: hypothetical protein KatS3mg089_0512 [Patescibacteria group bacterium]
MAYRKIAQPHVVCLGGGIGTVNLIKGLKLFTQKITAVVSMADDGGSSGRLRRKYNIFPPGDIVSCMAALSDDKTKFIEKLLTYRFPGDRYGSDNDLAGHKLGNLIMVAARDITGSFDTAIEKIQQLFTIHGNIYPATNEAVSISATTIEGIEVHGEEAIDLGKYDGKRVLDSIRLIPQHPRINSKVINALKNADLIIAGPGDLYTTILPVLVIPEISDFLKKTPVKNFFIINLANKPFETTGYSVSDFVRAVEKHLGIFPFDSIIVNNNYTVPIPTAYHYDYVQYTPDDDTLLQGKYNILQEDLVNEEFPLYHDPKKLAELILKHI